MINKNLKGILLKKKKNPNKTYQMNIGIGTYFGFLDVLTIIETRDMDQLNYTFTGLKWFSRFAFEHKNIIHNIILYRR